MYRKIYIFSLIAYLFFGLNLKASHPPFSLAQLDQITKLKKEKEIKVDKEETVLEEPTVVNWPMVYTLLIVSFVAFFVILYRRSLDFRQLLRTAKNVIFSRPRIKNYIFLVRESIRFVHDRLGHDPWAIYKVKDKPYHRYRLFCHS